RADDRDPEDAKFTSAPLELARFVSRRPDHRRRLLGIAWTELAPDYDRSGASMRPKLLDYSETPPVELRPATAADLNGLRGESVTDVGILIGDAWTGPFRNPAFSPTLGPSGRPLQLPEDGPLRYTAKLKTGLAGRSGAILLSSPVFDDVTLFFEDGAPRFL